MSMKVTSKVSCWALERNTKLFFSTIIFQCSQCFRDMYFSMICPDSALDQKRQVAGKHVFLIVILPRCRTASPCLTSDESPPYQ